MRLSLFTFTLFFAALMSVCVSGANASEDDPVHVIVSLDEQSLKLYRGGKVVASSNVSTGKKGHSTPTGIFSILQKKKFHRSNIYSGAPMPFMQRLTWSGIALHASNSVPGHPASHGCVRLPNRFAKELFSLTKSGAHVIIDKSPDAPKKIKHPVLFQPAPLLDLTLISDQWVADYLEENPSAADAWKRNDPVRIFITRRTLKQDLSDAQRMLNELGHAAGDVDGLLGPATQAAIRSFEKSQGKSETGRFDSALMDMLYATSGISKPANGHIFVRQYFRQVLDAPIHIKGGNEPLGAHLLTVQNFKKGDTQSEWMAVTLEDAIHSSGFDRSEKATLTAPQRELVTQALSRIEMDVATRNRIERILTPRSSLSISDNGLSIETFDKGTDFIVLTKPGENSPEA